jgi:hypothetical protein
MCVTFCRIFQANLGAKNHVVIMPDADVDSTVKAIAGMWVALVSWCKMLWSCGGAGQTAGGGVGVAQVRRGGVI